MELGFNILRLGSLVLKYQSQIYIKHKLQFPIFIFIFIFLRSKT